jgi:hypothetical protein
MTSENDDYEEAASILDDIIAYRSPGNSQDEYVAKARAYATVLVTALAMMRSTAYQTPEYLEETIYRTHACVSSPSVKEYFPAGVMDPEAIARFRHFGSVEGVEESFGNSSLAGVFSQEYTQTIGKMQDLLFGIRNNDDTAEIDEAIENARSIALTSSPTDTIILNLFGNLLNEAFKRTNRIQYLNESISVRRQLIESPLSQAEHFLTLPYLFQSLLARSLLFPDHIQDLDEALELFSQYVSGTHGSVPDRFRFACAWALFARDTRHSSVSSAYETALSLLQDTVLFSPTLQLQHATLARYDYTQSLSLDYASYRVPFTLVRDASPPYVNRPTPQCRPRFRTQACGGQPRPRGAYQVRSTEPQAKYG